MHIRYIESFLVLYEEGNISKACQKLFITQQGLSRQIQTVEKELGTILFERAKSGVVPTEVCMKIHPHFRTIYDQFIQSKQIVSHHQADTKKPITIAFAYGISQGLNTDVIMDFQRKNPDIHFKIKEWSKSVCMEKLKNNDIDMALLVNPFDMNLFDTTRLTEGYMYVALHRDHPLANKETIDFGQLDKETIITGSEENALRELFDHYCDQLDIQPNIMFSSSYSLDIINSSTDQSIMATVTPIMAQKITNPNIRVIRLLTPEPGFLYLCLSKTKKRTKDLNQIRSFIKEYFSHIPVIKLKDTLD